MQYINNLVKRLQYVGTNKESLFMWSCIINNTKKVLDMADIMDTLDFVDDTGESPLTMAVKRNHEDIVEILLDNGANINFANSKGQTPIMLAIKKGNFSLVRMLLNRGSDIYKNDVYGKTALMYAAYKNPNILNLLLNTYHRDKEADITYINRKDNTGKTALIWACLSELSHKRHLDNIFLVSNSLIKQSEAIISLIKYGANVSITDDLGKTALMYAVDSENTEIIQPIIEKCGYEKYKNNACVGITLKNLYTAKRELKYIKDSEWYKWQIANKELLETYIEKLEKNEDIISELKNKEIEIKEQIRSRLSNARFIMNRNLRLDDAIDDLRSLAVNTSRDNLLLKQIKIITRDIDKKEKMEILKGELYKTEKLINSIERFKIRIDLGIKHQVLNIAQLYKDTKVFSIEKGI